MTTGRLAVLSNVNMNMVIRMLQKNAQVYEAEGYGNELGTLLNPQSSYHAYHAEITFLIMDLAELLEHDLDPVTAEQKIGNWFRTLEGCLPRRGLRPLRRFLQSLHFPQLLSNAPLHLF